MPLTDQENDPQAGRERADLVQLAWHLGWPHVEIGLIVVAGETSWRAAISGSHDSARLALACALEYHKKKLRAATAAGGPAA